MTNQKEGQQHSLMVLPSHYSEKEGQLVQVWDYGPVSEHFLNTTKRISPGVFINGVFVHGLFFGVPSDDDWWLHGHGRWDSLNGWDKPISNAEG